MKTFNQIKRQLRTRYRPGRARGSSTSRSKISAGSKRTSKTLSNGSAAQQTHVPATPATQAAESTGDTNSYEDARNLGASPQSPSGEYHEMLTRQTSVRESGSSTISGPSRPCFDDRVAPGNELLSDEPMISNDHASHGDSQLEVAERAEPLSVEEPQRRRVYVRFRGEAPEDYTEGPARMVSATDGVKEDCTALLMTLDLSAKIQRAILRQREFARAKAAGTAERRSLLRLELKIGDELVSCRARLAILDGKGEAESEKFTALKHQKSILELMLKDVEARREGIHRDVDVHQAQQLLAFQAAVNMHLEEAFIAARLLSPEEKEPEPEIEELDVTQEYQAFCEQLAATNDESFEYSVFDHNSDHLKPKPLSEEEQARQTVINDFWRVKDVLDSARREFDNREAQRDREYQDNIAAADNGGATTDESPEAFDVRWVMQNRNLTRNLIDAEATYAAKKREVLEAGIPLPFTDAGTAFEDTTDVMVEGVGYDVPEEQETVVPNSPPGVRRWLSKLSEDAEAEIVGDEARGDADEWEAEEVGISDSVSVVAEGKERARIDRWRQACSEARED